MNCITTETFNRKFIIIAFKEMTNGCAWACARARVCVCVCVCVRACVRACGINEYPNEVILIVLHFTDIDRLAH